MRIFSLIALLFPFVIFGQIITETITEEMPNDSVFSASVQLHTSVKPYSLSQKQQSALVRFNRKSRLFSGNLNPLVDLNYRYFNDHQFRSGAGIALESNFQKKWHYRASIIGGIGSGDSTFQTNSFAVEGNPKKYSYLDAKGRITYMPNEIFNFQVGIDHNFIGEGNRSMFLSDYGKVYPFGQIKANFWRLEYTILYQFFKEQVGGNWQRKNGATHHISFNAAKWLNFSIFESVIFQPKDTLLNRGFDAEYLNPVVFYRPQEYSLGSSDNVLLGVSFTAKYKKQVLYGQLILDEFFLAEIKAKSGWWANKYGGQIGIKGRFIRGKSNLFYRTEYNFSRPYTYSHLSAGQNYGNQGMPLAHPYGGNFMELLGEFKLQRNRWSFKTFFSYFLMGYDKNGFSYGSNIYEPYTNRPYEYGHFIGQGKGNNGVRSILTVSYKVSKYGNLQLFFENQFRYDTAFKRGNYIPLIGLRGQLWNDYRNY